MSQTTSGLRSAQRGGGTRPTTPVPNSAWTAEFLRRKGWESKNRAHQALLVEVQPTINDAQAVFTGATARQKPLADGLNPLKHKRFKAYHEALGRYETAGADPNSKYGVLLQLAAETYVNHSAQAFDEADLDAKDKRGQRLAACQSTLEGLRKQGLVAKATGAASTEPAIAAATLKAEQDLASLPQGQQFAAGLGGDAGVNPSFWIKKQGANGAREHTFLFKPATNMTERDGVPKGGEPAREALSARAADMLGLMSGIAFGVPETQVVAVDRSRFGPNTLSDKVADKDGAGPLVGSLQQFAPDATKLSDQPPALKYAISAQRCQELAILDITLLHLDRHSGNYMITGDESGADLIPIDNGLTFPDENTALADFTEHVTDKSVLLTLPGAHERFSDKMLGNIAKINPAALAGALKAERNAIESVHPSATGMISDTAIDKSQRATEFLKLAAPSLSPALVQYALSTNAGRLLDTKTDDGTFQQLARDVIAQTAAAQKELSQYLLSPKDEIREIETTLKSKGWPAPDPNLFLKLFKSGAVAPAREPVPDNKPVADKDGSGTAINAQEKADIERKRDAILQGRNVNDEVAKMKAVFKTAKDEWVTTWVEFNKLGGLKKVTEEFETYGILNATKENLITKPALKPCYNYLLTCQEIADALQGDANQGNADAQNDKLIKVKLDLLAEVASTLQGQDAAEAKQVIDELTNNPTGLTSTDRIAAIGKARDKLTPKLQASLQRELDALPRQAIQQRGLEQVLEDAAGAIKASQIVTATKLLGRLRPTQNPNAQQPGPNASQNGAQQAPIGQQDDLDADQAQTGPARLRRPARNNRTIFQKVGSLDTAAQDPNNPQPEPGEADPAAQAFASTLSRVMTMPGSASFQADLNQCQIAAANDGLDRAEVVLKDVLKKMQVIRNRFDLAAERAGNAESADQQELFAAAVKDARAKYHSGNLKAAMTALQLIETTLDQV